MLPVELRTERLVMRPWRSSDAAELLPLLEANAAHIGPWIPARVAKAVPMPELSARLAEFGDAFPKNREWRYAMRTASDDTLLGELSVFPRSADARVAYEEADRAEIGYWLRADATGNGLVTEAVRAAIATIETLSRVSMIEIRCDARNERSAAVPRRLGFTLSAELPEDDGEILQVWTATVR